MIFFIVISFVGGIALLLYGIRLAGEGLQKAAGGRLRAILTSLTKNRYIGIGVGAVITAILQSSSAATVMLVGFVSSGLMTLNQTIGVILGANIGTCAAAILTSIGANLEARQVAAAHILFKIIGVSLFYPLIGPFKEVIEYTAGDIPRQIANAHTLFNVAIAVIFLPFANPFANLVRKIIPEREGEERFGPKYLDPHVLNTPSLALGQATREALRMSDITQWMLKESIQVIKSNDRDLLYRIEKRDDELDLLDREIKLYLTRIAQSTLTPSESKKEFELIAFTSNMENIGDIIDKNLMELAKKKITSGVSFSEEGLREIVEFHQMVLENFDISVSAFVSRNKDLAKKILRHKARLGEVERDFRQAHINRLHEGLQESVDTSAIHLDVLSNLKRINSHITNIAYPILEENGE